MMAARSSLLFPIGCSRSSHLLPIRTIITTESVPIITKPVSWTNKYIKRQEAIKEKQFKDKAITEKFKNTPLVISCKNTRINLYKGKQYNKFEAVPLASQAWKKNKSLGDKFIIHPIGKNPAVVGEENSFQDCNLNPALVQAIESLGFSEPTNIQVAAIPAIMGGQNTLIAAETGNGKTLAFLTPLIHEVQATRHQSDHTLNSPIVIVLAPGRELAMQIKGVCASLCSAEGVSLRVEAVLGGDRTKLKMRDPTLTHMDVLVATPGVLSKLITTGVIKTDHVRHVVLDEADTLLDDSFSDVTRQILRRLPIRSGSDHSTGVQLVLVGATLPTALSTMLEGILEVDSFARVSTPVLHHILPHVLQKFHRVTTSKKLELVLDIAKRSDLRKNPTIIFSNSSPTAHWLGLTLKELNVNCIHIGGTQDANVRRLLYKQFMSGDTYVLSATDIISRGLDTINVGHVINYDIPRYVSDYIHRCGRVGRVGSRQTAPTVTNLVSKKYEVELVQRIEIAARRRTELPDVDANISKQITLDLERREQVQATRDELKETRRELRQVQRLQKRLNAMKE